MTNSNSNLLNSTRRGVLKAGVGTGVVATISTVPTTAQQSGTLQWTFSTDDQVTSPTVVNGTVFFGSEDGNIYAIDAANGEKKWSYDVGGTNTAPAVVDNTVFVEDLSGYALDATTGDLLWEKGRDGLTNRHGWTLTEGKIFYGNKVVRAINANTGEILWTTDPNGKLTTAVTVANGNVLFGNKDSGALYALDTNTGEVNWTYRSGSRPSVSPTVVDNTVIAGSGRGDTIYALDINSGDEQWRRGIVPDGEVGSLGSSPTVANGSIFIGGSFESTYALDVETGDKQWTFGTPSSTSHPTVAGGSVIFGGNDGRVYAIDEETGSQQWALETTAEDLTAPTIVDGTVFIGARDGNMRAIDTDIEGSSEDTRVNLGTYGHHGSWQYANQNINIEGRETESTDQGGSQRSGGSESESSQDATPGFGVGTTGVSVAGASYFLKRRFNSSQEN